ncbi:MAG: DUF454 family protein, partial [Porticoccaceae bacterium]|nr:DUF454 family protein [Porticoccaceae bacterium]
MTLAIASPKQNMHNRQTLSQGIVRVLLLTAGSVSVVLGVVGIVLPLLPTTPFLLLAAACYVRSSNKFYTWLVSHPV